MHRKEEFKKYCKNQLSYFKGFTKLQDLAFDQNAFWDKNGKNIFVQGHTSSGKTLISFSQIWNLCDEDKIPNVLYLVPYKALAYQKYEELKNFFPHFSNAIALSTSEFKERDQDIISGIVQVVVTIYEKIFVFSNQDNKFFEKWNLLILDEFGIIDNLERGIKADFIFRKIQEKTLRSIVMVTPFYDWSLYTNYGDFLEISSYQRPVQIEEYLITQKANQKPCWNFEKIYHAPENTSFLNTSLPIHLDIENIGYNEMLYQICYRHYLLNHTIIVFLNDREGVRQHTKKLYSYFLKRKAFQKIDDLTTEQYFKKFLGTAEVNPGDLYGVFEDDDESEMVLKRALYHGITFHSAAQSFHIRRAIENYFYRNVIQIIFATETLAFGVNSSADVVIIGDIKKPNIAESKILTQNEYKNYIGRAGRLGFKEKGVAYTLVRNKESEKWKNILYAPPSVQQSNIYKLDWKILSMYILSIFVTEQALSEDNILTYLMEFPMHQKEGYLQYTEKDIRNKLQNSLHALYQQNFIRHELFSKRYIISDLGKAIRGYIFDITKFSELWTTIAKDEIYTFDFSYSITNCLPDKDINAFIPNKKKYADNIMSLHIATELYFETWINKKIISKQMAEKIKNIFYTGYRNEKQIWHLKQCQDSSRLFPVIRIATMVTMHLEGYSMREIYQITNTAVGINTSTMTKIAYFAEITSHLSSYKNDILKSNKIKSISTALYYGGMPYKMISMLDNTSLSANDKETLFFINRYFNMKTKKNKTQFDKIKIENMKQRMHKLPEKYSHIIKNLEINND